MKVRHGYTPKAGILRWKVMINQWNIRGTKIEALVEQRTPSTHLIFDAWSSAVGKTWKLLRKTRWEHS